VAVALAAGLVAAGCGAGQDPTIDLPSTSSPTPSTIAPAATSTTTTAAPAVRPATWVAIDRTGRLLVLSAETGEVQRVLGEFDHPTECPQGDEPAAGCEWVVEVALSPDGATVFYETCCEPAPGNVYRVPVTGGEPELVVHGGFPAVDPGGTRLAVVELQWVAVQPLAGGPAERFADDEGGATGFVHGMTWSPDGESIAFSVSDASAESLRLHVLRVGEASDFGDARPVPQPPADSWTLPAYRRDGLLFVAEQELLLDGRPTGPARGLVVDPRTGAVVEEFEYGGAVQSQHLDATGSHLLYTLHDGSVRWRSPDGASGVLAGDGYLAATW